MGRKLAPQQHHAGAPAEQNGQALAKGDHVGVRLPGRQGLSPGPIQWRQADGQKLTGFAHAQGQVPSQQQRPNQGQEAIQRPAETLTVKDQAGQAIKQCGDRGPAAP